MKLELYFQFDFFQIYHANVKSSVLQGNTLFQSKAKE